MTIDLSDFDPFHVTSQSSGKGGRKDQGEERVGRTASPQIFTALPPPSKPFGTNHHLVHLNQPSDSLFPHASSSSSSASSSSASSLASSASKFHRGFAIGQPIQGVNSSPLPPPPLPTQTVSRAEDPLDLFATGDNTRERTLTPKATPFIARNSNVSSSNVSRGLQHVIPLPAQSSVQAHEKRQEAVWSELSRDPWSSNRSNEVKEDLPPTAQPIQMQEEEHGASQSGIGRSIIATTTGEGTRAGTGSGLGGRGSGIRRSSTSRGGSSTSFSPPRRLSGLVSETRGPRTKTSFESSSDFHPSSPPKHSVEDAIRRATTSTARTVVLDSGSGTSSGWDKHHHVVPSLMDYDHEHDYDQDDGHHPDHQYQQYISHFTDDAEASGSSAFSFSDQWSDFQSGTSPGATGENGLEHTASTSYFNGFSKRKSQGAVKKSQSVPVPVPVPVTIGVTANSFNPNPTHRSSLGIMGGGMGGVADDLFQTILLQGVRPGVERVLDEDIAEGIRPNLPPRSRIATRWHLIYSLDQHGTSLGTLYDRMKVGLKGGSGGGVNRSDAENYQEDLENRHGHIDTGASGGGGGGSILADDDRRTSRVVGYGSTGKGLEGGIVVVVRDSKGSVFGAYVNEGLKDEKSYYGDGTCFLWKATPYPPHDFRVGSSVKSFKWTGKNDYLTLTEHDHLSFGGGKNGKFGLWIDHLFEKGYTTKCETFENEPLTQSHEWDQGFGGVEESKFDVLQFECWAIGV